jgi:hypothetical protein
MFEDGQASTLVRTQGSAVLGEDLCFSPTAARLQPGRRRGLLLRLLCTRNLVGAVVAFTFCLAPSTALGIGYGFADGVGAFNQTCPNNSCSLTYSYFRAGLGGSGVKYVRFFVPYDIIATARNGACDYDYSGNTDGNGTPLWESLYYALVTAKAQGLTPMITISPGNATLDNSNNPLPDKNQNPSIVQYACGFYYLVQTINSSSWNTGPITDFEAYNEPENLQTAGGVCGSTAAAYWEQALADDQALARSDNIVAGAFMSGDDPLNGSSHPDCGHPSGDWFVPDYLSAIATYTQHPSYWSWHPYIDVENGDSGTFANATTANTDSYINSSYQSKGWSYPRFWLTETGVYLHGSEGSHLVGSASGQANAAEDFLTLQNAGNQAYTGQIGRLDGPLRWQPEQCCGAPPPELLRAGVRIRPRVRGRLGRLQHDSRVPPARLREPRPIQPARAADLRAARRRLGGPLPGLPDLRERKQRNQPERGSTAERRGRNANSAHWGSVRQQPADAPSAPHDPAGTASCEPDATTSAALPRRGRNACPHLLRLASLHHRPAVTSSQCANPAASEPQEGGLHQRVLDELRAAGELITTSEIEHISPPAQLMGRRDVLVNAWPH